MKKEERDEIVVNLILGAILVAMIALAAASLIGLKW